MSVKTNKYNVAMYCRVACKNEDAMKTQRQIVRKFAEEHGHIACVEYLDNGASGLTLNRPGFSQLQEAVDTGRINTIIVKDISRISRDIFEFERWLDKMRRQGVNVITVYEGSLLEDVSPFSSLLMTKYLATR